MEVSSFNEKCRQTWADHELEQTTAPLTHLSSATMGPFPSTFVNSNPLFFCAAPYRRMHLDSSRLATSVPIPPFPFPVPGKRNRTVEIGGKECKSAGQGVF